MDLHRPATSHWHHQQQEELLYAVAEGSFVRQMKMKGKKKIKVGVHVKPEVDSMHGESRRSLRTASGNWWQCRAPITAPSPWMPTKNEVAHRRDLHALRSWALNFEFSSGLKNSKLDVFYGVDDLLRNNKTSEEQRLLNNNARKKLPMCRGFAEFKSHIWS